MKTEILESQFAGIGARFRARAAPAFSSRDAGYVLDIQHDGRGAFFELRGPASRLEGLDVQVLQAQPRERHLLLLVRSGAPDRPPDRFLCGHDERDWFVAAVPGRVSRVADAMESLKPEEVRLAQVRAGLTARQRNVRKNRAFRRQGEWFFVPAEIPEPDAKFVLRDEPIRRGRGKPHWVGELYREGGVDVWVCSRHPNGVTEARYRALLAEDPSRGQWYWRRMRRDAAVYARGKIRHPDHRTITLRGWHRVMMNTEGRSQAMRQLAFLD